MKKTVWLPVIAFAMSPLAGWSAEKGETRLSMDQLPAAVKATIQKETAGAKVEEIEKETEGGKSFYEAEFETRGGRSRPDAPRGANVQFDENMSAMVGPYGRFGGRLGFRHLRPPHTGQRPRSWPKITDA